MRVALGIEYDGTNYYGWQRQAKLATIQGQLELALSKVAAEPVVVNCAGRTDAGVHALGQVAHFDTTAVRSSSNWLLGTNSNLPPDIRILWVRHVAATFHARYSAQARHYRYLIYNNRVASAMLRHRALWLVPELDATLMDRAGDYLLGEHDFTSFRGSGCQSQSKQREVQELTVTRNGAMLIIDIKANAFLLHMVRNIVGVLIMVGRQIKPPIWVAEVLQARNRNAAAITAPPQGLYLVRVEYGLEL